MANKNGDTEESPNNHSNKPAKQDLEHKIQEVKDSIDRQPSATRLSLSGKFRVIR